MFKLIDGRAYCYQWDIGQKVTMDGLAPGMQVHFSHLSDNDPNALVVVAKEEDGIVCADVPNILLQTAGIMKIYGYITDGSAGYTKTYSPLHVAARAKPADYVYTETETLTYQALEDRIDKLEENGGVNVTGAQVGQTIKVSEIDENGKPTAWEAVDFPKQMQPDWNQSDSTAADYVKNRTHYEQEVSVDISGTEYGPVPAVTGNETAEHNLNIPFQLGQKWSVLYDYNENFDSQHAYEPMDVLEDESGQLYIGAPNLSDIPFYITQNTMAFNRNWLYAVNIYYIKLVCVSGSIPQKELVKLDEKFIPESIVADWNENDETKLSYIKHRPFYTGDPVETVLVEESTITFDDTGEGFYAGGLESTFEATVGETYKVSWDGTVYECTCGIIEDLPAIGNLSILGASSDTGEPFLMGVLNGEGIHILTTDTSASHTFFISRTVEPVVKIDKKYLVQPDWNQNDETAADYVKNRTHYDSRVTEEINITEEIAVCGTGRYQSISNELWKALLNKESTIESEYGTFVFEGEILQGNRNDLSYVSDSSSLVNALYVKKSEAMAYFLHNSAPDGAFVKNTVITCRAKVVSGKIQPLDEKFIPDTIARTEDIPKGALIVNFYTEDGENWTADHTFDEIKAHVDNGGIVDAVLMGLLYMSLTYNEDDAIIFIINDATSGIFAYIMINSNNDVIFVQNQFDELFVVKNQGGENSGKFLMVGSGGVVAPSDLIIQSSTDGSDKKFKITVDDSGTISATEVTA